jgi:hypothetical protein
LLILTIRGLNSKGKIRISGKNIGVAFGGNDRFRKIAIARQWIAGIPGGRLSFWAGGTEQWPGG